MPLNIGGVDPLIVKCKQGQTEVSLDAIKVGSDYVWSRHIPLTCTGSNATYTINRKTSPWHHGNIGTVTILRYQDTYQLKITPATNYYIYDYTINGTSQIADGSHFIKGARTTDTLTASGTEIKITVTAKRLYTLTVPKVPNSYFHYSVYSTRNNGGSPILTAGTSQKTTTLFEGEKIWHTLSTDYTCYILLAFGTHLEAFKKEVKDNVTATLNCFQKLNYMTGWSGDRATGWIRNGGAAQYFYSSDNSNADIYFDGNAVTTPSGKIPTVRCISWMSFGTKSNQTAYSGDKTLTVYSTNWSGHLKHASWTGSFSMTLAMNNDQGAVTFKGSSMGAYYAKGHIKSWSGLHLEEIT